MSTKYTAETLPKSFKFTHGGKGTVYSATVDESINKVDITWSMEDSPDSKGGCCTCSMSAVLQNINSGSWMSKDLTTFPPLKPFQRVLLRNGEYGIVTIGNQHHYRNNVITLQCGWVNVMFSGQSPNTIDKEYEIVEIFNAPRYNSEMLDIPAKGESLWKEADKKVTAADQAIEAAEIALAAAKAARAAL